MDNFHSVYLIFHLLHLKHLLTGDSTTTIKDLASAFYEFLYNINDMNSTDINFDFETELENTLNDFSAIFMSFDDEISLIDNPDNLFDLIPELLEDEPTPIDIYMEDALYSSNIYEALNLPIPIKEMKPYFDLNSEMIPLYYLLAYQELEHKNNVPTCKILKYYNEALKQKITTMDSTEWIKIKQCLSYYNNLYLADESLPNINFGWHIALFGNNSKIKKALNYDKIFYLCDLEPEEVDYSNIKNGILGDEQEYFLNNFFLYFHEYIKNITNYDIKKNLLIKKYLLLSNYEFRDIENYLLEHNTLDGISIPALNETQITESHFEFIIGSFEEFFTYIETKDNDITKDIYSNIITCLLLIKCYLNLSINETIKNELIADLTKPEIYGNNAYLVTTNLIDDIILKNYNLENKRNR